MKLPKVIFITIIFLIATTAIFLSVLYLKGDKKKGELKDHEQKRSSVQYIKLRTKETNHQLEGSDTSQSFLKNAKDSKSDSLTSTAVTNKRKVKFTINGPNPNPTDDDCVFTNKFTIARRLKHYPFSKAAKIIVVSYRSYERIADISPGDTININDTVSKEKLNTGLSENAPDTIFKSGLHIHKGKLNYSSLIEIKKLNTKQTIKLTNIIYNTTVRKQSQYVVFGYSCYNPRNAFIFYDRDGKIFEYLEVCFECREYRSLSNKISVGSYCNQKFDLLKNLLIDVGIKYGTTRKD